MSMMLRFRIWLTARASATKRETICGFDEYCLLRTLIAAVLPMSGWTARYTAPKPLPQLALDAVLADGLPHREIALGRDLAVREEGHAVCGADHRAVGIAGQAGRTGRHEVRACARDGTRRQSTRGVRAYPSRAPPP